MSQTFEDRVEEVLGDLAGMAWPVLTEDQKRRIVGKVAKGIDTHGDTQAAWARALRVSTSELSRRIRRFRSSEPIDSLSAGRAGTVRSMKSLLRGDPELIDGLLEDRQVRGRARAILEEEEVEDAWDPIERAAAEPSSETRNIAAMGHLADGREAIHKGVTGADFSVMSAHDQTGVEVLFRGVEGDVAVARASMRGEVSDEAIDKFIREGV